ncbi:hypothetical protein IWQ62_003657 [Dispira parvispora]|uniref:Zn(2)-C6 fungal-type domain-containing protein n=1 Tax=Dispira parvispora TaxID=1520584 RepID=A0A9W8AN28_9FUNG|nr:hypothetical protein IWQ62_003657 [Dispira parvispora]
MSINRRSPVVDNEGRYVYSPALEVQQHHNKSAGFGESNPAAELSAFESVSPVSHSATGSTLLPSSSGPRSPTLAPGSAFTSAVGFNTELQVATGRRLSSTYLRSAPLPVTSVSTISSPLASPTSGFVMSPLIPQRSPPGPRAMPLPPAKPHKGTRTALPSSSGSGNVRSGTTRAKLYVPKACINCRQSKVACETRRPCQRCVRMNKADTCVDAVSKRRGRPGGSQLSSASSGKGSSVKLKSVTKPPNTDASEYQSLVTVVANTQGNTQMQAPGNTTPADSHVTRDSEEMAPAVPQRTVPPRATNYRFRLYMDQRNEQPWSRQMDEDGFVHYLRMPTTTPGTSLADVQTPSSTTTHSAQGRSVFVVGPGPTGSQGQPPQSSSSMTTNRSRDKHSRPE